LFFFFFFFFFGLWVWTTFERVPVQVADDGCNAFSSYLAMISLCCRAADAHAPARAVTVFSVVGIEAFDLHHMLL
jgi:hypothetical protein